MSDQNFEVVVSIVEGKICINGVTFGVNQLREAKEYLLEIGAITAQFTKEADGDLNELHSIAKRMEEASPEAVLGVECLIWSMQFILSWEDSS